MTKLQEDVTRKSELRAAMNTIKALMKDKSIPKSVMEHLEALDVHFKKTWEGMQADGTPEVADQKESLHESITIGTRLEGELHTQVIDMVDDLYECGAITREEMTTLHQTVTDILDAFYTAIMQDCPQLYDRSPWMNAPEPDEGAIMQEAATKSEDGKNFPASDYAYVPDPAKSSTWKLRLTKTPGGDPDAGIVGAAAAALGKGFRGQKVQIPVGDLAKVKAKVRAAWSKANPDKKADEMPDGIKESLAPPDTEYESAFVPLVENAVGVNGIMRVKLIQPGWGSSGYYSPQVLKDAARTGVFGKATKMFADHPTPTEDAERPERSIKDLVAETTTDAQWQDDPTNGPGLYAQAKIINPAFSEALNELAPHIGVSIRALGRAQPGQAEGKQGQIISEITNARSCDFVTEAGAGGKIISMLEARRVAAQSTTLQGDENMGEIETLKESNAQLKSDLEKLQEKMILREAGEYAAGKLAGADLPVVTKARLSRELVKAAPIKEGKLDTAAFDAQITEAIKSAAAEISEVIGSGHITGMGSTPEVEHKPEDDLASMKESYMAMGYSEAIALSMAKGRN